MFRIPSFYQDALNLSDASLTMKNHGRGDILEGMESMNRNWIEHCATPDAEDETFYENWQYEVNAYNKIFSEMQPLFA